MLTYKLNYRGQETLSINKCNFHCYGQNIKCNMHVIDQQAIHTLNYAQRSKQRYLHRWIHESLIINCSSFSDRMSKYFHISWLPRRPAGARKSKTQVQEQHAGRRILGFFFFWKLEIIHILLNKFFFNKMNQVVNSLHRSSLLIIPVENDAFCISLLSISKPSFIIKYPFGRWKDYIARFYQCLKCNLSSHIKIDSSCC